ncbi:hypothetical protein LZ554_001168 [Drepanopeziza brunnea f. sp. 'monogermtubi']|nr:hypothetical protein LZ554_001168 [Drepanopeziza brunnea f. sp. 'monogermtubi']
METPSPSGPSQGTGVIRRKGSSPWHGRILRFSPYLPNPLLPVPSTSTSFTPKPNPLFQAPGKHSTSSQSATKVTNLELPFKLRDADGHFRQETQAEREMIRKIFPTMQQMGYRYPYLVITVTELPAQPWPVTLAGLPLWLADKPDGGPPMNLGLHGRGLSISVDGEICNFHVPSRATIVKIFQAIIKLGGRINKINWDGMICRAYGVNQPSLGWREKLPRKVNGFPITYFWTPSDTGAEKAVRRTVPAPDILDDTNYLVGQDLRPGVMVEGLGNDLTSSLSTTSGICVQSLSTGQQSVTLAAHGFPAGIMDAVYHPRMILTNLGTPDHRFQIGHVDQLFEHTDIALMQLEAGINYSRETFLEPSPDYPPVKPFHNMRNWAEGTMKSRIKAHGPVFMNTPFNGQCEGVHTATEWNLAWDCDSEFNAQEIHQVTINFFSYWGNGDEQFLDGSCGGVIWNENFDVLGQFKFQKKDGDFTAIGPTFDPLIDAGYILAGDC